MIRINRNVRIISVGNGVTGDEYLTLDLPSLFFCIGRYPGQLTQEKPHSGYLFGIKAIDK